MPPVQTAGPATTALRRLLLVSALAAAALLALDGCAPPDGRDEALRAIARWEDRRLADGDSLATMLRAGDAHVRRAAARAAGLIGRDDILPALCEALADRSGSVREEAAFALGILGSPQAVPALVGAARGDDGALRLAALEGLAHLEHDGEVFVEPALLGETREAIRAWDGLRNRAAEMDHVRLVATIQSGLAREEDAVVWRVLRCAERAPDSTLVAQIAPFALARDTQVRVHALRALARHEGPAALAAVLASCEDRTRLPRHDEERVGIAEMRALGALGGPGLAGDDGSRMNSTAARVAQALAAGCGRPSLHVARTALDAMAQATGPLILPAAAATRESLLPVWRIRLARAVREMLAREEPVLRAAAVAAHAALRGWGARERVLAALDDGDPLVETAAVRACAAQRPTQELCARVLAIHRDGERDPRTRLAALETMAGFWRGAADSLDAETARDVGGATFGALADGAAGDDFVLAATAVELLGGLPSSEALRVVLDTFARTWEPTGTADVRLAALGAAQEILTAGDAGGRLYPPPATAPDPQAATTARDTAAAPDAGSPLPAIAAGERAALAPVLERCFDDPDLRIRQRAREAAAALALLPPELIPTAASLAATLPATVRSPAQPPLAQPFDAPRLRCSTPRGDFVIQLDGRHAPNTCASILALVERGFYDGLTFHRVVPDFVIQGGCPRGDGWGGPGYAIRSEWSRLPYERGTVGIAHSGKDTGGSQWFVCHSAQPHLNGRYTVWGRVVDGMEVVDLVQPEDVLSLRVETR